MAQMAYFPMLGANSLDDRKILINRSFCSIQSGHWAEQNRYKMQQKAEAHRQKLDVRWKERVIGLQNYSSAIEPIGVLRVVRASQSEKPLKNVVLWKRKYKCDTIEIQMGEKRGEIERIKNFFLAGCPIPIVQLVSTIQDFNQPLLQSIAKSFQPPPQEFDTKIRIIPPSDALSSNVVAVLPPFGTKKMPIYPEIFFCTQ